MEFSGQRRRDLDPKGREAFSPSRIATTADRPARSGRGGGGEQCDPRFHTSVPRYERTYELKLTFAVPQPTFSIQTF